MQRRQCKHRLDVALTNIIQSNAVVFEEYRDGGAHDIRGAKIPEQKSAPRPESPPALAPDIANAVNIIFHRPARFAMWDMHLQLQWQLFAQGREPGTYFRRHDTGLGPLYGIAGPDRQVRVQLGNEFDDGQALLNGLVAGQQDRDAGGGGKLQDILPGVRLVQPHHLFLER